MTQDLQEKSLTLGIVIAGGGSTRMGDQNKLLLPFGDKTVIDQVIDRLRPQVSCLYLNCNDEHISAHVSVKVVPDEIIGTEKIGPIGGLYTALKLAKSLGFHRVVTAPGDIPFLPDDFVMTLSKITDADVVVAASGGHLHPLLALWSTNTIDIVATAIERGQYKMKSLLNELAVAVVTWEESPDPLFNVNNPEDYKVALMRL